MHPGVKETGGGRPATGGQQITMNMLGTFHREICYIIFFLLLTVRFVSNAFNSTCRQLAPRKTESTAHAGRYTEPPVFPLSL